MPSMESFIIMISLAAAAGGGLVLLACLAGKRSHLSHAFNLQQQMDNHINQAGLSQDEHN